MAATLEPLPRTHRHSGDAEGDRFDHVDQSRNRGRLRPPKRQLQDRYQESVLSLSQSLLDSTLDCETQSGEVGGVCDEPWDSKVRTLGGYFLLLLAVASRVVRRGLVVLRDARASWFHPEAEAEVVPTMPLTKGAQGQSKPFLGNRIECGSAHKLPFDTTAGPVSLYGHVWVC